MQQLSNHKDLDVRKCFVVDSPEYSFLQFDFSAQELCVMAGLSQDPLLMDLIKHNKDLHSETVRRVWPELANCTDEEIKTKYKDKRNIAKTTMFALAYGAGPKKIAFTIQRQVAEAEQILNAFKEQAYPVLTRWLDNAYNRIEKEGGARIYGGYRRRYKPTGNKFTDFGILRSINNSRIQGASSYITKVSTLRVLDALNKSGIEYKLVILIHDSITIQVKDTDVAEAYKIVESAMTYDFDGVPILAIGAVNKDMSKVTEQDLDTFLGLGDED